jgi:hypothetical protein
MPGRGPIGFASSDLLASIGDNASALRILAGTLSCATNRLVFKQAAGRAALTI